MKNNSITFAQYNLIMSEDEKIKLYEKRFNEILRIFSKTPFMQLYKHDLWEDIIDLSEPVLSKDYSKYLFKQLDKVFIEFEELQNDDRFNNIKENILNTINRCNEYIKLEEEKKC